MRWPSHLLNLLASSPAFLDRPADWPPWHQLCGFLELPSHEHEEIWPRGRARSCSSGPPPVFMGFGSLMPVGGSHLRDDRAVFEEPRPRAGAARSFNPISTRRRRRGRSLVTRSHPVRQADASQARLPPLRGRGPPCRRRNDAYDASRGHAVGPGAARVRSIRRGRRTCSASGSRHRQLRRTKLGRNVTRLSHQRGACGTPQMKTAATAISCAHAVG